MKFGIMRPIRKEPGVTPCVGVWIEMSEFAPKLNAFPVTPCVGVWIEITADVAFFAKGWESLPAWECGLKSSCPDLERMLRCHSLRGSVD